MMTSAEHEQTRTYGYLGKQTKVAEAGTGFRDVLASDIKDVRSIVGSNYNQGMLDLLQYYRDNFPALMVK